MIKEGKLNEKGRPNEKTPAEWFTKIGLQREENASSASKLKQELSGQGGDDEEVDEEEAEEVEQVEIKKKKKKSKKEKVVVS